MATEPMATEPEIAEKSIVSPDVQGTIKSLEQFVQLKTKVLSPDDVVVIEGKKFIKRSGWRKISLAFNISTVIVDIQHEKTDDDYIVRVRARATAPNGRISEGIAACSRSEFTGKRERMGTIHNIEATASTRAINRAISDLVGGGEVSAEEIITEQEITPNPKQENEEKQNIEDKITDKQLSFIKMLTQKPEINEFVSKKLGDTPLESISKRQASALLDEIKQI